MRRRRGRIARSLVAAVVGIMCGITAALSHTVDLDDQTANAVNQMRTFTVAITNAPDAANALGFDITFDPVILRFDSFTGGPLVQNWDFFSTTSPAAGRIRVGGFTTKDVITAGTSGHLVLLNFTVVGTGNTMLTIVNPVDGVATWTLGTGQFTFTTSVVRNRNDLDGDGKADILWRHTDIGILALWRMDGGTLVANSVLATVDDQRWQVQEIR